MSRAYGHRGPPNSGPRATDRYDRAMMSKGPHRVAVLALPAVIPLELGIAAEIFGRDPHYRLTVCAEGRSASLPGSGLTVNTPAGLEGLKRADTLIIPGYEDTDATVSTAVLDAIRAAHARGARLVSICTAAFALAAAGVLDDRPATTHWRWTAELQDRYPRIDVLPNRLFVDDGDILTSAGVTTGIDLCLHLVRRDFGSAAANTRARGLVAPPQRQGGQAQFIERLMPDASGDQLGPLREWMLENLALPLDLGTLATRAHMSRRTLSRRFREETGVSPMAWLADARIDRAREILETTTEPVENIGRLTGLGADRQRRRRFVIRRQIMRPRYGHRSPAPTQGEEPLRCQRRPKTDPWRRLKRCGLSASSQPRTWPAQQPTEPSFTRLLRSARAWPRCPSGWSARRLRAAGRSGRTRSR